MIRGGCDAVRRFSERRGASCHKACHHAPGHQHLQTRPISYRAAQPAIWHPDLPNRTINRAEPPFCDRARHVTESSGIPIRGGFEDKPSGMPPDQPANSARARRTFVPKPDLAHELKNVSAKDRKQIEQAQEMLGPDPETMGFVKNMFWGNLRQELVFPFPEVSAEETARCDQLLAALDEYLRHEHPHFEIDQQQYIPEWAIKRLFGLGVLGMIIPREYGGVGTASPATTAYWSASA